MKIEIKGEPEFYEALGRTITAWADLEAELYHAFRTALDGADKRAARAAFYAALSFQVKLAMTTDTITARLNRDPPHEREGYEIKPHPLVKRWQTIHDDLVTASKKRNLIAHLPMQMIATEDEIKIALRPNYRVPKHEHKIFDENVAWDKEKLDNLRKEFQDLGTKVSLFVSAMGAALKPPAKSAR
jgi:hypothetical protein